jgi:hypothetical protein
MTTTFVLSINVLMLIDYIKTDYDFLRGDFSTDGFMETIIIIIWVVAIIAGTLLIKNTLNRKETNK